MPPPGSQIHMEVALSRHPLHAGVHLQPLRDAPPQSPSSCDGLSHVGRGTRSRSCSSFDDGLTLVDVEVRVLVNRAAVSLRSHRIGFPSVVVPQTFGPRLSSRSSAWSRSVVRPSVFSNHSSVDSVCLALVFQPSPPCAHTCCPTGIYS